MASYYAEEIVKVLRARGLPALDPRHVEAYMRLDHSTLDGLSTWEFNDEVSTAAACVLAGGEAEAEALAESMGLRPVEAREGV